MKQILQDLKNGNTELIEAPQPQTKKGQVLVQTTCSLISAGTERMLVDFGKGSYIQKARQQPEKVREVVDKARTDGFMATYDAVRSKLEEPIPLGYSNVGRVTEIRGQKSEVRDQWSENGGLKTEGGRQRAEDISQRSGVRDQRLDDEKRERLEDEEISGSTSPFKPGDRVVSNGPHAEVVRVPKNLCAKIPDSVSDKQASFTVVGAIGLQGIRLADPSLGEAFVVIGAGLIGLITVQLLQTHGCRVLAIDFDDYKLDLARKFGAETCNPGKGEDPVAKGVVFSRDRGVDGVLICAATKSNEPVAQAARMCRKRGRIVLVGVTGLELNRSDFYEKELTFQVSCSYGPGRYDPEYEEKGQDYPFGFVRWTEQRNFEAVLDMMADGRLNVEPLITHRFAFEDAPKAYETLRNGEEQYLGILLEYSSQGSEIRSQRSEVRGQKAEGSGQRTVQLKSDSEDKKPEAGEAVVSFIGAGNYASRVLIPAFKAAGARLETIVTSGGTSGVVHGRKAGFASASTDVEQMLSDGRTNTVVIATRHNTHAGFVKKALEAGKHVFVEKPLCLSKEQLNEISDLYADFRSLTSGHLPPILMVGFNRRFAPQIKKIKGLLEPIKKPASFIITVNAGDIPQDHWIQDPEVGGGRIIGEACHFIDLLRYLSGSKITSWSVKGMDSSTNDTTSIQLGFDDGSLGTVHYFSNGSKSFPKERLEIFCSGGILQLDNFRKLKGYGWPGFKKMNLWRQDKGQKDCAAAYVDAVRLGKSVPILAEEIFEVSRVAIDVDGMLRSGGL